MNSGSSKTNIISPDSTLERDREYRSGNLKSNDKMITPNPELSKSHLQPKRDLSKNVGSYVKKQLKHE